MSDTTALASASAASSCEVSDEVSPPNEEGESVIQGVFSRSYTVRVSRPVLRYHNRRAKVAPWMLVETGLQGLRVP